MDNYISSYTPQIPDKNFGNRLEKPSTPNQPKEQNPFANNINDPNIYQSGYVVEPQINIRPKTPSNTLYENNNYYSQSQIQEPNIISQVQEIYEPVNSNILPNTNVINYEPNPIILEPTVPVMDTVCYSYLQPQPASYIYRDWVSPPIIY